MTQINIIIDEKGAIATGINETQKNISVYI